eukprot:TRINITY_DN398_c0_g1_i10.p5 TRINITY_DN398_c0_g1~~TRINITY_DN398_c0_g1_i10.p5  ORF type:complete len:83 (-),score=12.92 TRINITY_DN398_c0_g1_i10:183-431(-)
MIKAYMVSYEMSPDLDVGDEWMVLDDENWVPSEMVSTCISPSPVTTLTPALFMDDTSPVSSNQELSVNTKHVEFMRIVDEEW